MVSRRHTVAVLLMVSLSQSAAFEIRGSVFEGRNEALSGVSIAVEAVPAPQAYSNQYGEFLLQVPDAFFGEEATIVAMHNGRVIRQTVVLSGEVFVPFRFPDPDGSRPPEHEARPIRVPVVSAVDPNVAEAGTQQLRVTMRGSNFTSETVFVTDVPASLRISGRPVLVSQYEMQLLLDIGTDATPGPVEFTAINPAPSLPSGYVNSRRPEYVQFVIRSSEQRTSTSSVGSTSRTQAPKIRAIVPNHYYPGGRYRVQVIGDNLGGGVTPTIEGSGIAITKSAQTSSDELSISLVVDKEAPEGWASLRLRLGEAITEPTPNISIGRRADPLPWIATAATAFGAAAAYFNRLGNESFQDYLEASSLRDRRAARDKTQSLDLLRNLSGGVAGLGAAYLVKRLLTSRKAGEQPYRGEPTHLMVSSAPRTLVGLSITF